jgi:hypothetical protein
MFKKEQILFLVLGGFFITNALIAEFIGVKIFSLEGTLGIPAAQINLFGIEGLSFNLTAGVLLWPIVFVMTDIINEYYGMRGVRLLSWMAAGLIAYAFLMVFGAMKLEPAGFWHFQAVAPSTDPPFQLPDGTAVQSGSQNMQTAFSMIFGQGLWIIIGSLTAFLVGQLADVFVFHKLKRITGNRAIWVRATGSTLVSQLIDSFVVLFIAFYLSGRFDLATVFAIGVVNYIYKFVLAVVMTPLIYVAHWGIEKYLGKERAEKLAASAHGFEPETD